MSGLYHNSQGEEIVNSDKTCLTNTDLWVYELQNNRTVTHVGEHGQFSISQ